MHADLHLLLLLCHEVYSREHHISKSCRPPSCLEPSFFGAGCTLLVAHEAGLQMGLLDLIHSDKRGPQLWHLNKEGLLSLPGYWALALISVGLTTYLHPCANKHDQGQETARVSSR